MGIETNKDSNHKYKNKYYAYYQGTNSRLDEIQAAILSIKLKKIKTLISSRQNSAKIYLKNLYQTDLFA